MKNDIIFIVCVDDGILRAKSDSAIDGNIKELKK